MDTNQEQIEEIFCAALETRDPGQRVALLDDRCGNNPGLRAKVEQMLTVQTAADRFFQGASTDLESVATVAVETARVSTGAESWEGTQVGPYRLVQRLGEGGCGVVYLAEQIQPVKRQVALKLIKIGMDTHAVIARFESERQTLALMDHPNIARVLDAGATEAGRPYFVMELVRGVKLTGYCNQERLGVPARLDLFIQVCLAIQHAHQKGIIHRDIKPSNVLVTMVDGRPVPKVIDFGIAKATSGQVCDGSTVATSHGQFIGTPAYVSPEQAALSSIDIDTRSDIYSLGVLLYELLTGKTPFDQDELLRSGFDEMRRTLREVDPRRPSVRLDGLPAEELTRMASQHGTAPQRLKSLLRGDLDWVVMKALEKDRDRRYQTATELAIDLRRYLDHEPVVARPPTSLYKLQKLVRRNRTMFAALTVAVSALILGFGFSTWSLLREREARREQIALRREAEARASIAQAAILLSRNRYQEADQLVDKLNIPVAEPSLEASGVFRSLGGWNVVHGRWRAAADRFQKLMEANQVDKVDMTDQATRDLLLAGPALLAAHDLDGYRRTVQQAITRFAGTTNPVAAEQVIKIATIKPIDKPTAEALAPMAAVIEKSVPSITHSKREIYLAAWQELSLSLFEFRRGNAERAFFWAQKCLDYPDTTPTRIAMARLVLAMYFVQKNQPDRARVELDQVREVVGGTLPDKLQNIPFIGTDHTGYWNDWAIACFLLDEASAMTLGVIGSERGEPMPKM